MDPWLCAPVPGKYPCHGFLKIYLRRSNGDTLQLQTFAFPSLLVFICMIMGKTHLAEKDKKNKFSAETIESFVFEKCNDRLFSLAVLWTPLNMSQKFNIILTERWRAILQNNYDKNKTQTLEFNRKREFSKSFLYRVVSYFYFYRKSSAWTNLLTFPNVPDFGIRLIMRCEHIFFLQIYAFLTCFPDLLMCFLRP